MTTTDSDLLDESLARLADMDEAHLELGAQMFKAYGGAFYGMDLLAVGALNRSKAQIAGFRSLLQARNLICAGALLRLQLDTACRFYAAFLVEKPHEFALAVLGGEQVCRLKDRSGQRMTDRYLVNKLGEEYEWVPRVYERTSGYVHLSATHILSALSRPNKADDTFEIELKISAEDGPLPAALYVEAADAFVASTDILLRHVHGWAFTKANPDLVEKWKKQGRESEDGA